MFVLYSAMYYLNRSYIDLDFEMKMFKQNYKCLSSDAKYLKALSNTDFADKDGNVVLAYKRGFELSSFHRYIVRKLDEKIECATNGNIDKLKKICNKEIGEKYMKFIANGSEKSVFCKTSAKIIDLYKSPPAVLISLENGKDESFTYNDMINKNIVSCYVNLCTNFVDIIYTCENEVTIHDYCSFCGVSFDYKYQTTSTQWTCPCGNSNVTGMSVESFKNNTSEYNPLITFMKDVKYVQGKCEDPLPSDMMENIDKYFRSIGYPKEKFINNEIDQDGIRKGTCLEMMIEAFEKCGYTSYFKRTAQVSAQYWGWELPNFDPYIENMVRIYQIVIAGYRSINKDRKSNIPTQNLVLNIANLAGSPVSNRFFKLPKTVQSKSECEHLWMMTCMVTGLMYSRVF